MTAIQTPAPDAPGEEWGALAERIPGFQWMPGMHDTEGDRWGGVTLHDGAREVLRAVTAPQQYAYEWRDRLPDPDDHATAGCLLALHSDSPGWHWVEVDREQYGYRLCSWLGRAHEVKRGPLARNPGRACIAYAAALGRWPGGDSDPYCPDCGGSISEHQHHGHHGPEWRCPDGGGE